MAVRRFYSPGLREGKLELDPEQAAHARKVLRVEVGDVLELFDGAGGVGTAQVVETGRRVVVDVERVRAAERLRPVIDLAVAVPKGGRADVMVEKASELGADRLIPLLTDRSVVDPRNKKLERFERLAMESAKQCGRNHVMVVDEPTPLERVLAAADHDLKLIAHPVPPEADGHASVQNLPSLMAEAQRVIVLIGPEGGWTQSELSAAFTSGFRGWRLGPNVLRIETAACAALAILRQQS